MENPKAMFNLALFYEVVQGRKDKAVLDLYLNAAEKVQVSAIDKVFEAYIDGKFNAKKKTEAELTQLKEKYDKILEEIRLGAGYGH